MKANKRVRDPRRIAKDDFQSFLVCSDGVERPTTATPREDGKYILRVRPGRA